LPLGTEGHFHRFEIYLQISVYFAFKLFAKELSLEDSENYCSIYFFVNPIIYYNTKAPDTLIDPCSGI